MNDVGTVALVGGDLDDPLFAAVADRLIDAPGHHLEPVVLPVELVVRESA